MALPTQSKQPHRHISDTRNLKDIKEFTEALADNYPRVCPTGMITGHLIFSSHIKATQMFHIQFLICKFGWYMTVIKITGLKVALSLHHNTATYPERIGK